MTEYVCDIKQGYPGIPYEHDVFSGTMERREEIVRCRDCKHAIEHRSKSILGAELVTLTCSGPIQGAYSEGADVEPEDFCSWASRLDDGQCRTLR